jgi:hypothetical protein
MACKSRTMVSWIWCELWHRKTLRIYLVFALDFELDFLNSTDRLQHLQFSSLKPEKALAGMAILTFW